MTLLGYEAGDVPSRAGQARNEAGGDRVADARKYYGDRSRLTLECSGRRSRVCEDHVGFQADQLLREHLHPINITGSPPSVHPNIAAIRPTQLRKPPQKADAASAAHPLVNPPKLVFRPQPFRDAPFATALELICACS
jgi:hypothetical protein